MTDCLDLEKYQVIDIKYLPQNAYFHYTNINNIDSIFQNGLEPLIGDNAVGIEKVKRFSLQLALLIL